MNKLKHLKLNSLMAVNIRNGKWNMIPWPRVKEKVFKLQRIIYKASLDNNVRKVRRYQHLLVNSMEAKLLAVRRVTQDNTGKATAGVDGIKSLTPKQRLIIAATLFVPTRAKPLRRVWIPKPGKVERRPLGIPTIYDRCLQALFKSVLEPEWEAKFEPNSYGFRPGRSCRDAVAAIRSYILKKSKYVLDADIAKCFDLINHEALLDKIGMVGLFRKQLLYWLKAGVLDDNPFSDTDLGTPQGGVISPLLANIALHGMEKHLQKFVVQFPIHYSTGTLIKKSHRAETLGVIRYADDFVIMHQDKEVILACYKEMEKFLATVGLKLSPSKTRLSHTLELQVTDTKEEGFDGIVGFNFLGFTIKQFKSKYGGSFDTTGKPLGYKTLIYPSKKSIDKHQQKLHDIILVQGKGMNQLALIKKLNPIVRGWSNYFGAFDANTMNILTKMDYLTYLKLRQWSKRVKGTSGKGVSYFHKVGNNKWTFCIPHGPQLVNHWKYASASSRIVKIRGEESPYSANTAYWTKRLLVKPLISTRAQLLLSKQKGICNLCKHKFYWNDIMEVDHIVAIHNGGSNEFENLQLLHRHCHDSKTVLDKVNKLPLIK
jgi:RNA-directed DNA polymerase